MSTSVERDDRFFKSRLIRLFNHFAKNPDVWNKAQFLFFCRGNELGDDDEDSLISFSETDHCHLQSQALFRWLGLHPDSIIILGRSGYLMLIDDSKGLGENLRRTLKSNDNSPFKIVHMRPKAYLPDLWRSYRGKVVGVFASEISDMIHKLSQSSVIVDISEGVSRVMAVKKEEELYCIQQASSLSVLMVRRGLLTPIKHYFASNTKVSHYELAESLEQIFNDPARFSVRMPPGGKYSPCYNPIIQSGGDYNLDWGVRSTKETLTKDVVTISVGASCDGYCCNIARTFLFNPPNQVKAIYEMLLGTRKACLSAMQPGRPLKSVYQAATGFLKSNPEYSYLRKHLPENLGFGTGLLFQELMLSLTASNENLFEQGMVFCLRVAFENLETPAWARKGKNPFPYVLVVSDTIKVNESDSDVMTDLSCNWQQIAFDDSDIRSNIAIDGDGASDGNTGGNVNKYVNEKDTTPLCCGRNDNVTVAFEGTTKQPVTTHSKRGSVAQPQEEEEVHAAGEGISTRLPNPGGSGREATVRPRDEENLSVADEDVAIKKPVAGPSERESVARRQGQDEADLSVAGEGMLSKEPVAALLEKVSAARPEMEEEKDGSMSVPDEGISTKLQVAGFLDKDVGDQLQKEKDGRVDRDLFLTFVQKIFESIEKEFDKASQDRLRRFLHEKRDVVLEKYKSNQDLEVPFSFPSLDSMPNADTQGGRKGRKSVAARGTNVLTDGAAIPNYTFYAPIQKNYWAEDEEVLTFIPSMVEGKSADKMDEILTEYKTDYLSDLVHGRSRPDYHHDEKNRMTDELLKHILRELERKGLDHSTFPIVQAVSELCNEKIEVVQQRYDKVFSSKDPVPESNPTSPSTVEEFDKLFENTTMDSYRVMWCRHCHIYNCNNHGLFDKPSIGVQLELSLHKEKSGFWKKAISRNENDPIFQLRTDNEHPSEINNLTSFQESVCLSLLRVFEGNTASVARAVGVTAKLVEEFLDAKDLRGALPHSNFSLPPKRTIPYYSVKNYRQPWYDRYRDAVIFPYAHACMHNDNCSDENCTCVKNKFFCTPACSWSSESPNFFRGCDCKGGCNTKLCTCVATKRECDPNLCNCDTCQDPPGQWADKQICRNDNILMRRSSEVLLGRSDVAGYGIYNRFAIKAGQFVVEYVGEAITQEEAERRGQIDDERGSSYHFLISSDLNLDARRKGNIARFINHSNTPNLEPRIIFVKGEQRVGIFATQDIPEQTELTFHYQYDLLRDDERLLQLPVNVDWMKEDPPPMPKQSKAPAKVKKKAKRGRKRKRPIKSDSSNPSLPDGNDRNG